MHLVNHTTPVKWRVELHSHTWYSKDCLTSAEAFVNACRRARLDRVAITDHNTAAGALKVAAMASELVIVGEEIMTTKGEILAFFVRETVPPMLSPDETIRRLRDQGAFISVSHPYDRLRKGAWEEPDLLAIIERVDAIEIFNSRCMFPADNDRALTLAKARNLAGTVGSDAHVPFEIGRAVVCMAPFSDAATFAASLKTATLDTRLSPIWVHATSTYAKWMRKLGLNKQPLA